MDENAMDFYAYVITIALSAVIFFATFVALLHIESLEPFSHDEAVYLTKARSWLEGTPANQWGIYRPIGMSAVSWVALHFGDSERALRTVGVLFGALTASVIFLFFRRLTNLWIALSITAIVTCSYLFLQQAGMFLNDIASSAFLIGVMWMIYIYFKSSGQSNAIYLAAPFAAIAFYLRYGVIEALAMIAVCSIILVPRFFKDPDAAFDKFGKTVLLTIVLFAPHFLYSLIYTKEFLGILRFAGEAAHRAYIGEGLVQYFQMLPAELAGWPLGLTAIVGAIAAAMLLSIRELRAKYLALAWVGAIGLSTFIITGLLVHAEPRYVFFPLVLLSGVGLASIYYLVARWSTPMAVALMLLVVAISFIFGVRHYRDLQVFFQGREQNAASVAYSQAHEAIRRDAEGASCSVWLAQFLPRASWYTGCSVYGVTSRDEFNNDAAMHPADKLYSITATKIKDPQISIETAPDFRVILTEIFHSPETPSGQIIVYRISKFASPQPTTTLLNFIQ